MAKKLSQNELNHNEFDVGNRGEWRKYNPYNPYEPEKENDKDLKVDSLDDLFEDEPIKKIDNDINDNDSFLGFDDDIIGVEEETKPVASQKKDRKKDEENDLQKELEAKFDELFGPMDDEED